jgi:hypothetical protein
MELYGCLLNCGPSIGLDRRSDGVPARNRAVGLS